ncbi:Rne/Rng family ribonuclease [Ponticaulis sp.]|uniref:Rne/Rng family ribonuclease n=1 Tax=Ponticaulis sp. TaxID=2020902 RepID=UPI000C6B27D3|nr:Rne/Rng family ribonuclease [Ponticaulis sp.]MAJ08404.1 ribonuclease E/G [Ponticaulis sp.]|tara:strand:- start:23936 stop:26347 length:2412 start_codon:yes stop_codon:yes gene_type:complete
MTKMMLIDAVHPEEVRVAVVNKGQVEDFDFESAKKRQLRGNIYLAKITRVEPSLQAAFVDFGGNRHGFLAFSEIHPDYYQLPQADREALIAETASAVQADGDDPDDIDEDDDERPSSKALLSKNYKIQEVIRRRQIMLVQAVKEERGNKGAALTTYLSLAGRYCVLMPNTPRGGGISRKITNSTDRKRLKEIVRDLNVPEGMGLIVRTAGAKRTKTEIKRDFEYLIKLWSKIRELTLSSVAPCLINEEAGLVHRALRDMYDKDIDQVLVDGEVAYREAKDLSKMLMPSHAKKVQQHKSGLPVFSEYGVEPQLDNIFSPTVQLKSGGYLVIHQTEALVAIDVNSGKSTRERNIEQTALRTNLEAAEEACRQMRLRDLAGLVVIDFIDMEEAKNNRAVERRMKDCMKYDRARVQNNKISMFGLMEISRQRRRAGVLDTSSDPCTACSGTGHVRSIESSALQLLRAIESRSAGVAGGQIEVSAPTDVVLFLLNEKRQAISDLEIRQKLTVQVKAQSDLLFGEFEIRVTNAEGDNVEPPKPKPIERVPITDVDDLEDIEDDDEEEDEEIAEEKPTGRKRRRRGRRKDQDRSSADNLKVVDADADDEGDNSDGPSDFGSSDDDDGADGNSRKRRRRGRRGGRRRRGRDGAPETVELNDENTTEDGGAVLDEAASNVVALVGEGVEIKATAEAKPEPEATADDDAETSEAAPVSEEAEAATLVETSEPETAPEQESQAPEAVSEAPAEIAEEPATEETPSAEVAEEAVPAEPAAPAAEAEAEAEEPKELPETEKPKKIRRGWWQRRSAG